MLYDLNIVWSPTTAAAELERTLKTAKHLGYDVVALNNTISSTIPNSPHPILNPIPMLTRPPPSHIVANLCTTATATKPGSECLPTTLRRATVVVADPTTTNYRLPDHSRAYDLLAVRPSTEKAFSWACTSTTEPPPLISMDLSIFLPWHFAPRTCMAAVTRGSRFEICYGQALGAGVDNRARSTFLGNMLGLLRATKGRGVVVSSEARSALGLRAPADVVNLLAVWGLGPEMGIESLGTRARAVVVNEGIRRRGFRGVVDVVEIAREPHMSTGRTDGEHLHGETESKDSKKDKKRKKEDGDDGDGGGHDEPPVLSKRQAKKLRKEAQKGKRCMAG